MVGTTSSEDADVRSDAERVGATTCGPFGLECRLPLRQWGPRSRALKGTRLTSTVDGLRGRLSLGVVAVVGAGSSLGARYPNTVNLTALVWDAIDADPHGRAALAKQFGVPDAPTKALIGDDWGCLVQAWACIAGSQVARERFQHAFVELDRTRASQPSASHEALAHLIHAGVVECVVSFNWDSALERAYERLYGTRLPNGILYKPHGDVAGPDAAWVLPHEDGVVGDAVNKRVRELAGQHPRTLLVVGYSESDEAVVEQLIAPLDERWRVCRVGPSVDGSEDVPGTADEVLSALAEPTAQREDSSAWHVVTFNHQRGIESAMEGRRLLPMDVEACPCLPEVEVVTQSLLRSHAVVLNGESGSGKSITAYQVAHLLTKRGVEVLRLRDVARGAGVRAWLSDLKLFPHRKMLFVDDAQDLSADTVRELAEAANADQLVLIAGVDHVAGGVVTHSVSGATAVGLLEQHVLAHRGEMLATVRQLDDRVGDNVADERFEDRVRAAARENSAWIFFYTLTGGWRRTARAVQEARAQDRADLLACALAVAQIAGVDTGVTAEDLFPYATAVERDRAWVERNLEVLRAKQLAVQEDGVWRCPHLRTAYSIINWMLHPPHRDTPPTRPPVSVPPIASFQPNLATADDGLKPPRRRSARRLPLPKDVIDSDQKQAAALFRVALDAPTTSMRGVAWLLGRKHSPEAAWVLRRHSVRSVDRDRALALRALATPPGPDVGMAAQLLEQLAGRDAPAVLDAIWEQIDAVVAWVHAVTPEVGWSVGELVNLLINEDRARLAQALEGVDPAAVARLVETGGWPHIYSTTKAIDRIAQAGGTDLIRAVGVALNEDTLDRMLDDVPSLASADELLAMFAHLNPDMGVRLFEKHADRFAAMFSPKPLENFHQMFETFGFLLGYAPQFLRGRHQPTPAAQRAARTFLRALDTGPLVEELSQPQNGWRWQNFWEFLSMYTDADPRGWADVAAAVDLDALEATLVEQASAPSSHLMYVLLLLAETRASEVRAMLEAHAAEVGHLHAFLVYIHPELAVQLLERGLPLDLGLEHQRYRTAASELDLIGQLNADIAREVAEANADAFRAGIASRHHPQFEDLSAWVSVCDMLAPGLIDSILAGLDEGVVAEWADALRKPRSKRQIAPLVVRAAETADGPASREATELMRQFTSLRREG